MVIFGVRFVNFGVSVAGCHWSFEVFGRFLSRNAPVKAIRLEIAKKRSICAGNSGITGSSGPL